MCVRARRVEEDNIIAHISSIIEKGIDNFTEEDQLKLTESQNKLDDIYRRKAEGAFVRSRKKWLEEGEQNSSYLFRLEKQRANHNTIHQLDIDGMITSDSDDL